MANSTVIARGVSVSAAILCGVSAALSRELGPHLMMACASVLCLVAAFYSKPRPVEIDAALAEARLAADAEHARLANERREFEDFLTETSRQLTDRARLLDGREVQLSHRMANFSEWLEYPQQGTEPEVTQFSDRQLSELDNRVMEIINDEAKQLYDRLRQSHYKTDGKIDGTKIRDDLHAFVIRVAQIYRPGSENPLLETSVDQLLRAGSRACLHLLVLLERLPLNLKDQTFADLHSYVQKAIKAYDLYAKAQPYMGYVQTASYVGRMLAGASPLTLGITWVLGELGKRGTKAAASWLIDQQAVAFLNEVVRVIGFEVASIYAGDFRHRDPNWVLSAELTDLQSRFPLSRENLSQSLREVGALPFRNEYDRIFLYRCLSAHRGVSDLADSHEFLSLSDRQQIARRLERYFATFIHGRTPAKVAEWKAGVESRLAVKLMLPESMTLRGTAVEVSPSNDELPLLVRSLASFLIAVKTCPLDGLEAALGFSDVMKKLDDSARRQLIDDLVADPPNNFFRPEELDASLPIVAMYVADLCRLVARVRPWYELQEDVVLETAVFLGQDFAKTKKQLDHEYSDTVVSLLPKDAPSTKTEPAIVRLVLSELRADESLTFIYATQQIDWPLPSGLDGDCHGALVGTSNRLLLVEANARGSLMATSPQLGLSLEKVEGRLIDGCRLTGTQWTLPGSDESRAIAVSLNGAVMQRFDAYFRPLLALCRGTGSEG